MNVSKFAWCLRNNDFTAIDFAEAAKAAEKLNYEGVYSVEGTVRAFLPKLLTGVIRSAYVNCALAASVTKKITIGTSIFSIYSRSPLYAAMGAYTLAELSNDRFVMGIGVGGPWLVTNGYGYPLDRPAARMREYIKIARGALSGQETALEGEFYNVKAIKMVNAANVKPRIWVAALNPAMLTAAGELADGVILNMFPIEALPYARDYIAKGAKKAGRNPEEIKITALTPCGASDDAAIVKELKIGVAFYASIKTHHKFLRYAGLESEAKKIHQAWNPNDNSKAISMITDNLLDRLTLGYSVKDVARRAKEYVDEGVMPLIYPHLNKARALADTQKFMKDLAKA